MRKCTVYHCPGRACFLKNQSAILTKLKRCKKNTQCIVTRKKSKRHLRFTSGVACGCHARFKVTCRKSEKKSRIKFQ